ncbi:unnamed protein product, partial [Amoebophrya sp. A120]
RELSSKNSSTRGNTVELHGPRRKRFWVMTPSYHLAEAALQEESENALKHAARSGGPDGAGAFGAFDYMHYMTKTRGNRIYGFSPAREDECLPLPSRSWYWCPALSDEMTARGGGMNEQVILNPGTKAVSSFVVVEPAVVTRPQQEASENANKKAKLQKSPERIDRPDVIRLILQSQNEGAGGSSSADSNEFNSTHLRKRMGKSAKVRGPLPMSSSGTEEEGA